MKQLNTVQYIFHPVRTHDYPWHMYVTWIFRLALVYAAGVEVAGWLKINDTVNTKTWVDFNMISNVKSVLLLATKTAPEN
jgi:hypothetical protein